MVNRLFAAIALLLTLASGADAAYIKISGTFNTLIGIDVNNIAGNQFLATLNIDNAGNIIPGGQLWMNPDTSSSTNTFLLSGGTVATGGGQTTFSNILASKSGIGSFGVLNFTLTQQIPALNQAGYDQLILNNVGGSGTWVIGGWAGVAAIKAVPEPSSALVLFGSIALVGLVRRKRS